MIFFIVGKGGIISKTMKKAMTTAEKQGICKPNKPKKGTATHTLPPKEPGLRSTPNN